MSRGKQYKYKGKKYYLEELSKFTPECVTLGNLSQRLCTGKFETVEECVDTPKLAKTAKKIKRRVQREPRNNIKPKVHALFWGATSASKLTMREC